MVLDVDRQLGVQLALNAGDLARHAIDHGARGHQLVGAVPGHVDEFHVEPVGRIDLLQQVPVQTAAVGVGIAFPGRRGEGRLADVRLLQAIAQRIGLNHRRSPTPSANTAAERQPLIPENRIRTTPLYPSRPGLLKGAKDTLPVG